MMFRPKGGGRFMISYILLLPFAMMKKYPLTGKMALFGKKHL